MNNNPSSESSAMLFTAFGGNFDKFDARSNILESELIVEEKRLNNMPMTAMFLTMVRKIELAPHPDNEHGHVLRERWVLQAAQLSPTSQPIEFEIEAQCVTDALADGDSPIVAALIARPDIVADLRARFSTFLAFCEGFEVAQLSANSTAPKAKRGPLA